MGETSFIQVNPTSGRYSGRIRPEEWDRVKPVLEKMHEEKRARAEMRYELEHHHHFQTSSDQLQRQMKKWGFTVANRENPRSEGETAENSAMELDTDSFVHALSIPTSSVGNHDKRMTSNAREQGARYPIEEAHFSNAMMEIQAMIPSYPCLPSQELIKEIVHAFARQHCLNSNMTTLLRTIVRDQVKKCHELELDVLSGYWIWQVLYHKGYRLERLPLSWFTPYTEDLSWLDFDQAYKHNSSCYPKHLLMFDVANIFKSLGNHVAACVIYLVAFYSIENRLEVPVCEKALILVSLLRTAIILGDIEPCETLFALIDRANLAEQQVYAEIKHHFGHFQSSPSSECAFPAYYLRLLNWLRSPGLLISRTEVKDYTPMAENQQVYHFYGYKAEQRTCLMKRLLSWSAPFIEVALTSLADCPSQQSKRVGVEESFEAYTGVLASFLIQQWLLTPQKSLPTVDGIFCDTWSNLDFSHFMPEIMSALVYMIVEQAISMKSFRRKTRDGEQVQTFCLNLQLQDLKTATAQLISSTSYHRCQRFTRAFVQQFHSYPQSGDGVWADICTDQALIAAQLCVNRSSRGTCASTLITLPQPTEKNTSLQFLQDRGRNWSEHNATRPKAFWQIASTVLDQIQSKQTMSFDDLFDLLLNISRTHQIPTNARVECRLCSGSPVVVSPTIEIDSRLEFIRRPSGDNKFSAEATGIINFETAGKTSQKAGVSMSTKSYKTSSSGRSDGSFQSMAALSLRAKAWEMQRKAGIQELPPDAQDDTHGGWDFSNVTGLRDDISCSDQSVMSGLYSVLGMIT